MNRLSLVLVSYEICTGDDLSEADSEPLARMKRQYQKVHSYHPASPVMDFEAYCLQTSKNTVEFWMIAVS